MTTSQAWPRPLLDLGKGAEGAQPAQQRDFPMTMYGIHEPSPGPRWQALYDATWSAYRRWFLSEGLEARADLATSRTMLQRHMPELVSTWQQLIELAGGDELTARMLSGWCPPRFLPGCSHAVLAGDRPVLIRNYDYSPDLFEQVCYSSEFTGRKVIGTSDCLWGLLDGMNEDGLVVSLAFGGRPGSGPGFGIPLVVRYLLEVASDVTQACRLLEGLPVSMAYNLTMTDATGATCTAYVAPGCPPEITSAAVATNHRGTRPDYPDHARSLRSQERQQHLIGLLGQDIDRDELAAAFLQPPLRNTGYSRAFGTLYTAVYRPDEPSLEYLWPGASWRRTFDDPDATVDVVLQGS